MTFTSCSSMHTINTMSTMGTIAENSAKKISLARTQREQLKLMM